MLGFMEKLYLCIGMEKEGAGKLPRFFYNNEIYD